MVDFIIFTFKYKAGGTLLGADGAHGFTFTGIGIPASEGWVATGNTRLPKSGGTGSTGS